MGSTWIWRATCGAGSLRWADYTIQSWKNSIRNRGWALSNFCVPWLLLGLFLHTCCCKQPSHWESQYTAPRSWYLHWRNQNACIRGSWVHQNQCGWVVVHKNNVSCILHLWCVTQLSQRLCACCRCTVHDPERCIPIYVCDSATGTQSTRVFLFDVDQRPIASHQIILQQIIPEAGWCEHDPMQIWKDVQVCILKACEVSWGLLLNIWFHIATTISRSSCHHEVELDSQDRYKRLSISNHNRLDHLLRYFHLQNTNILYCCWEWLHLSLTCGTAGWESTYEQSAPVWTERSW